MCVGKQVGMCAGIYMHTCMQSCERKPFPRHSRNRIRREHVASTPSRTHQTVATSTRTAQCAVGPRRRPWP